MIHPFPDACCFSILASSVTVSVAVSQETWTIPGDWIQYSLNLVGSVCSQGVVVTASRNPRFQRMCTIPMKLKLDTETETTHIGIFCCLKPSSYLAETCYCRVSYLVVQTCDVRLHLELASRK